MSEEPNGGGGEENGGGGGEPANWVAGIEDEDLRGWAENKGLQHKTPAEALVMYRGLEKTFGADKAGRTVLLPADFDNPEEAGAFYRKLGQPESPDGYAMPEGASEDFWKQMAPILHGAGVSERQAGTIAQGYMQFEQAMAEQRKADMEARAEQDAADLRKEWGAAYDDRIADAKRAAKEFGWDEEKIDALESVLGFGGLMRHAHDIGSRLGEDKMLGAKSGGSDGNLTPEAAKAELARLKGDSEFMDAVQNARHPNHENRVAQMRRLSRQAAGLKTDG